MLGFFFGKLFAKLLILDDVLDFEAFFFAATLWTKVGLDAFGKALGDTDTVSVEPLVTIVARYHEAFAIGAFADTVGLFFAAFGIFCSRVRPGLGAVVGMGLFFFGAGAL